MFTGMSIMLILVVLQELNNPWIREFENASMDWVMNLQAGTSISERYLPIAWIDIDEKTYQKWEEPLYTPRDKLAGLIRYAGNSDAMAVIVDIDVSRSSPEPHSDKILLEQIETHASEGGPPLVLVRTFRQPIENSAPQKWLEARSSFLENSDIIREANNIFWASTLFLMDDDRMIRRWRLWEPSCTENNQGVVIPSAQLLIASLARKDTSAKSAVDDLEMDLRRFTPGHCGAQSQSTPGFSPTTDNELSSIHVGDLKLDSAPTSIQQRLIYNISPNKVPSGKLSGSEEIAPLLVRLSAEPILDPSKKIDKNWLNNRIVIIGSSYVDAKDIHSTPLGELAGPMILANAINSLMHYGQITAPPFWVKLIILMFLITIMSLAFSRFHSFWGMLTAGLAVIILLLPLSFMVFRYGVWLDFAMPLLAVQLQEIAAMFERHRQHSKTKRMRSKA